jgi:hypothetical protein
LDKVDLFTIATNKYFDYWLNMVKSADKFLFLEDELTFHVFTNVDVKQSFIESKLERVKVKVHTIPNLGWPLATLYRYKYILEYGKNLDSKYFVHIDADMVIVPHKSSKISSLLSNRSIALILHPGYWRIGFPKNLLFYCRNYKYFLKDLYLVTRYGNLGTWSTDQKSKAYVPRYWRRKYFCGAVWLGEKEEILKFASELDQYTDHDLQNNCIPIHNDESYLNYWASKNIFNSLPPSFCYEESYRNLEYLNPIIVAIDKKKT